MSCVCVNVMMCRSRRALFLMELAPVYKRHYYITLLCVTWLYFIMIMAVLCNAQCVTYASPTRHWLCEWNCSGAKTWNTTPKNSLIHQSRFPLYMALCLTKAYYYNVNSQTPYQLHTPTNLLLSVDTRSIITDQLSIIARMHSRRHKMLS